MANKKNYKFYMGDILINGIQVSGFTVAPTKKRAAEIFDCSVNFINTYFVICDIDGALEDKKFKIAVDYPEKLFVNNLNSTEEFRLYLDKDKFISSSKLITDVIKKDAYINKAIKNKTQFLKVRLKDELALKNNMLADIFLDISKLMSIKQFFYIPFNDKLIDDRWPHKAIDTNHEMSFILEYMIDIYDEVVIPYSANEALDFVTIGE